jgi:hypothetical protein
MIRPPTKLLLAGLLASALLAGPGTVSADAVVRTYTITFAGGVGEIYSASDSTAFDIQRSGYAGCDYSQQGDIQVSWRNVWRLRARVQPRTAHVHVLKVKKISGPFDKHHPGDSEITGVNSNEGSSTQCSDGNRAGTIDCTAESVRPSEHSLLKVGQDPSAAKELLLTAPAFSDVDASYSGQAPSGLGCARSVGNNLLPGGFIGIDMDIGLGNAALSLKKSELARLPRHRTLHVGELTFPDDKDWAYPAFPQQGESCAIAGDGMDETCSYGRNSRLAELTIRRAG